MAIEHGLSILSWHEHLPKEDVPPEHLWEDSEGLEQWWATVEARRDDGGATTTRGTEPSETGDAEPGREMAENDYARHFKT